CRDFWSIFVNKSNYSKLLFWIDDIETWITKNFNVVTFAMDNYCNLIHALYVE
ncbi:unnamed protein product, partial [Rhizophagus irregularis]